MRALITRPEEDAAPLAQALADRGVDVTVEPLLAVRPVAGATVDLEGVQALLFTSANGVRAFASLSDRREIGVLTVGDGTAAAARSAGFKHVESAGGDVGDLVRLAKERLEPEGGALYHVAGSVVAGDLAGQLSAAGYDLRRVVLYEAKPAESLSESVVAALADRQIDLVLFFSPRTASTFVELVRKADDPRALAGCASAIALCLSPGVAKAAEAIAWKDVRSAAKPDLDSMLRLVDQPVAPATPAAPAESAPAGAPTRDAGAMSPPPLSPIAPPRSSNLGAIAAAAAIAAVIAVGAVATEPLWRPYLAGILPAEPARTDPALAGRLDTLEQQGVDLGQRLAAIDGVVNQLDARGAGAATDLNQLATRLDGLERQAAAVRQDLDAVLARPAPGTPAEVAIPAEIKQLPQRIAGLERRLDEVAAVAAQPSGPSPEIAQALDGLRRQVDALQTTAKGFDAWMGTMEARLQAAEKLEPRIAALEQASRAAEQRGAGNVALALAVNQLQTAVAASRPYQAELAALNEIAGGDPAIASEVEKARASLAPRAETGLPTLDALRAAFPEVARKVVAASRAERTAAAVAQATPGAGGDAEPGWLDQAMLKLSELVSVRPVGEDVEGDDAAARVARAEAALGKGDLAGAIAELDGLTGKARNAAAPWLADARARLEAESAVAALQSAAVARLAPVKSGG